MAFRNGKASCVLCSTGTTPPSTSDFPITCEADCPADVAVGDLVYVTGTEVGGVIQVDQVDPALRAKMPAIGIVTVKSTATRCTVHKLGLFTPPGALTAGSRYFVGSAGVLSASPPPRTGPGTETIVQIVGYAVKSDQLLFNAGDLSVLVLAN